MDEPLLGLIAFVFWLVVIGSISSATVAAKLGPLFVLQQFEEASDAGGARVLIKGRRAGLVSYVLSVLGLDTSVTFHFHSGELELGFASLNGETYHRVPVGNISSTHAGYSRQVGLLILAVMVAIAGLFVTGNLRSGERGIALAMTVALPALLVLSYSLSKSIRIAVESTGGMVLAVRFKGSMIEGKHVDLVAARRVSRSIGDASLYASRTPPSEDSAVASPPAAAPRRREAVPEPEVVRPKERERAPEPERPRASEPDRPREVPWPCTTCGEANPQSVDRCRECGVRRKAD